MKLTFEKAIEKLEKVVEDMEDENVTLDKSIDLYKEGTKLYKHCSEILNKLESEITVLKKQSDGVFVEEGY